MVIVDRVGRVRRWTRTALVLAAALVAASCSDGSSLGPIAPGHARLSLAPRFALVAGAPTIPLSRVEGSLTSPAGDSTFAKANFVEGEASLTFDVQMTGESADFILDLVGFDANGNEAYRAHQIYTIKPGLNDGLEPPLFTYSAADSKAIALQLHADGTTLSAGGTTQITVTGTAANETPISPIRVGFTSRNTDVATVDDAGKVTAKQIKGATYIVARTPGNLADSMLITTRGAVAAVVATPSPLAMFRGATANLTAEVRDPSGNVITDRPPTFATSNGDVVSVSATGVVSAVGIGSANITATVEGKTATVPVTVETPVASISLSPNPVKLSAIGATQALTVTITPKQGASTAGLVPTFTSSDLTIATVTTTGTVAAVKAGDATITAAIDGVSGTTAVSIITGLTVTPATSEKLPNGTQQFAVTGGNGPFTWQVNGVTGGNSTFGTISTNGFYTAPAAVPQPASFDICVSQESPAFRGCARMTINPIPSSGADVIVVNDMNLMQDQYITANDNRQFFRNIVAFTPIGPRSTATRVMFQYGHGSICGSGQQCTAAMNGIMRSDMLAAGISSFFDDLSPSITSIPSDVKVIFIETPVVNYSLDEINILKQFAAEGGRIVFIGENGGYYASGIPIENQLLRNLGAQLTNTAALASCQLGWIIPQNQINAHQITTNVTGLQVPCASPIVLGPNDYAIAYNQADATGTLVPVIAIAKIDVTPITVLNATEGPAASTNLTRRAPAASGAQRDTTGTGTPKPRP